MAWRLYHGTLVPAVGAPCFVEVESTTASKLLRESGAWLLRYSSNPCQEATEWWYIVCDRYDLGVLSSKMRNKINHGRRRCTVTRLEPTWLAEHGYSCYEAAFERYGGVRPSPLPRWREQLLRTIDGPFEHWGVFVGSQLAGYTRCVLDGNNVASLELKLDPQYLKERCATALISHLQTFYVGAEGKTMSNGNRAVAHETGFQEFLLEHGFRKQYCRLNVAYRGLLRAAITLVFPFRGTVRRLGFGGPVERVRALLLQEEWRRASLRVGT